ncbi:hypothetical protein C8J56DRAFT_1164353 [Mycena floridula]|nr:hypothetical protein C8J56DRAFT_1164353 [Mycena floridula]
MLLVTNRDDENVYKTYATNSSLIADDLYMPLDDSGRVIPGRALVPGHGSVANIAPRDGSNDYSRTGNSFIIITEQAQYRSLMVKITGSAIPKVSGQPTVSPQLAGLAVRTALPNGYKNELAIENSASIPFTSISGLAIAKMLIAIVYEKPQDDHLSRLTALIQHCGHREFTDFTIRILPLIGAGIRESALLFAKEPAQSHTPTLSRKNLAGSFFMASTTAHFRFLEQTHQLLYCVAGEDIQARWLGKKGKWVNESRFNTGLIGSSLDSIPAWWASHPARDSTLHSRLTLKTGIEGVGMERFPCSGMKEFPVFGIKGFGREGTGFFGREECGCFPSKETLKALSINALRLRGYGALTKEASWSDHVLEAVTVGVFLIISSDFPSSFSDLKKHKTTVTD